MNDLKTLINEEYKDITFDMKASYIISLYEKERRKKAGVFVTTAFCLFMIITVFIRMNPKTVETLMNSTGEFFSNLVSNNADKLSVFETTSSTQPNTSDNLINQIATSTAPTETNGQIPAATSTQNAYVEPTETPQQNNEKEGTANSVTETTAPTEVVTEKATDTKPAVEKPTSKSSVVPKKINTAKIEYILVSKSTIRITKCIPTDNTVVIPETIDGYTVTEIGEGILKGYRNVTKVTLPNTVTKIKESSFKGLEALKSVNIPTNIKSIGGSAFEGCTALESANLGNIEEIGASAFAGCEKLTEITIPKTAKIIGARAFAKCRGLEKAIIASNCDSGNDKQDNYTFTECDNLKSVVISEGVTSLTGHQFYKCTALKNVSLSSTLESISQSAFSCCTKLESIELPKNIKTIGYMAFYKCRALKNVTLPNSLKIVYSQAFYGCNKLSEITIPKEVDKLYDMCFGYNDYDATISDFIIKGYEDSTAKEYAKANKIIFVSLGGENKPSQQTTAITLDSFIAILGVGDTYDITYKVENPEGPTTFTSSDSSIATVDENGRITALKSGSATVTITNNGVSRQLVVIII